MARAINRLNWRQVQAMTEPGLYADGLGLYLRIDQTGSKRWVLIFQFQGRRREMGLGSAVTVKVAEARTAAAEAQKLIREGQDPIAVRKAAQAPPEDHTFSAVAVKLIDDLAQGWKSGKSKEQWLQSLQAHAPAIWKADVAEVDTEMVLTALRPIWSSKPETASRVRGRIERVLDGAKARGLREGENPARWRGHLAILLSKPKREVRHHAAMPYADLPAFWPRLAARDSISAGALRFAILTAARSNEVREADWTEIQGDVWVVPKERMKANRPHRVPLSTAARAELEAIPEECRHGLIFPGPNGPLSYMAMTMLLRKLDQADCTPHGFRSTFRDWSEDCTSHARETAEAALAHILGDKTEQAYRRGDALAKRRLLMEDWGRYCLGEAVGKVVQLRPA